MSEEIKFDPVFGPQELFNSASDDAVLAIKDTTSGRIHFFTNKGWIKSGLKHERYIGTSDNEIAMRRIIKTPVWTWDDKKAGRLPEVGCLAEHVKSHYKVEILAIRNGYLVVLLCGSETQEPVVVPIDALLQYYQPIETPAEKAQRERDEWIDNACSFICFYDIGRVDAIMSLETTYDKLKSGELTAPKGGE